MRGCKCNGSLLKEARWWLAVILTSWRHVRDQGTDVSLPFGWVSLHRCVHISHYFQCELRKGGWNTSKIIQLYFEIWTVPLDLDYQLLSNLQFRFPFGVRVALEELRLIVNDGLYISFCVCTKGLQKEAQNLRHSFVLSEGVEVDMIYNKKWLTGIFRPGLHGWVQMGPSSLALPTCGSETMEVC